MTQCVAIGVTVGATCTIEGMAPIKQSTAWRAQAKALFGTKTDADIARALGVTSRQVGYLRRSLKIEAVCRSRWQGEISKIIGVVPDRQIAQELNVSITTVQHKRKSRELRHERYGVPERAIALLGKISDSEMAAEFGRCVDTVRRWRSERNIAPVRERRPWKATELKMLGKMPDQIVARLSKRRIYAVKIKRESLKIAAFQG